MRARGLPRSRPQSEGHGAPRGANVLSRFLCDQEAHRLTALHGGDFGRGDRASGTGQTRHAPRSGWLSPAFILSASSRERQSHVVGPDGDPSLPDGMCARHARGRRILLRSLTPLESAPHEQDTPNLREVQSAGMGIPITKCFGDMATTKKWIPGSCEDARPGMTIGIVAAATYLLPVAARACSAIAPMMVGHIGIGSACPMPSTSSSLAPGMDAAVSLPASTRTSGSMVP